MLPVTAQFIVAMLAYALNERMVRRSETLREENRVFKEVHCAFGASSLSLGPPASVARVSAGY